MNIPTWAWLALASHSPCVEQYVEHGAETLTLQELRRLCQIEPSTQPRTRANQSRQQAEVSADENPYVLSAHYNNYILPVSYNHTPNTDTWQYGDIPMENWEVKFQLSVKAPVSPVLFDGRGRLYFAYTNQSWWQAYNKDASSPFRETNHMPELFFSYRPAFQLSNWDVSFLRLGINHQSNGQSGEQSRSWNRIIASSAISQGNWAFGGQLWYRLPEEAERFPGDPEGDDNPDITDYLGYGELIALYKTHGHNWSLRVKGNPKTHKGGVDAGWSFPLTAKLRGYVQLYYGYGESLIDYNVKSERVSIGFELTPWL